MPQIL